MDIEEQERRVGPVRRGTPIIALVLGLVLVGMGIWALAGAIHVGWNLLRDPGSIDYFARYFMESGKLAEQIPSGAEGLAHLMSWLAVVLLLLVLGKLGAWSIGAAARLFRIGRSD